MSVLTKEKRDWTEEEWSEFLEFVKLRLSIGDGKSFGSEAHLYGSSAIEIVPGEQNLAGGCYFAEEIMSIIRMFSMSMFFSSKGGITKIVIQ